MFQRHAYQFVVLCLSAVVTVSVMAGVNTMAAPQAAAGHLAGATSVMAPRV